MQAATQAQKVLANTLKINNSRGKTAEGRSRRPARWHRVVVEKPSRKPQPVLIFHKKQTRQP